MGGFVDLIERIYLYENNCLFKLNYMSGYCNYWIVYNILCIEWSFWSWVVVGVYIFYRYFMFFIEKYLLCELLVLDIEYLVLLKRNWIKWYSLGNINNSGIILNIFKNLKILDVYVIWKLIVWNV